ncbi:MAG TPA: hypothetical protein VF752_15380 [Thermoleophilaceae bacterium]
MSDQIVIRNGNGTELELVRLAALDSQKALDGHVLVAEAGGRARAAVAVDNGRAVSDPFYASAPLVDMLRLQAEQVERDVNRPRSGLKLPLPRRQRLAPVR